MWGWKSPPPYFSVIEQGDKLIMARKIFLASKLPRIGANVEKTYKNSRVDLATNRTVFFIDIEFEILPRTNTISNDRAGFPYIVFEYDLDTDKKTIHKPGKQEITVEDFVSGVMQSLGIFAEGHDLKFVATKEVRPELERLVKEGKLKKDYLVSALIMEKIEVNLDPFADDSEIEIKDDSVNSLADIRTQLKAVKDKKAKEVAID